MKKAFALSAIAFVFASGIALASSDKKEDHSGHAGHKASTPASTPAGTPATTQLAGKDMAEAEVRRIDKERNRITLKHGEIKNLDMPPMTMVFQVKDAALLDKVKEGDKVGFTADKIGGQYTVTGIEKK